MWDAPMPKKMPPYKLVKAAYDELLQIEKRVETLCECREKTMKDEFWKNKPMSSDEKPINTDDESFELDDPGWEKKEQDFKDFKWKTQLPKEEYEARLKKWRAKMKKDRERIKAGKPEVEFKEDELFKNEKKDESHLFKRSDRLGRVIEPEEDGDVNTDEEEDALNQKEANEAYSYYQPQIKDLQKEK
jgi:hypothetical protein